MRGRAWAGACLVGLLGCSLLVDDELEEVRCSDEGAIGPPACEVGQVCGRGRCRECGSSEACGDEVDNDCSGAIDDGCLGQAGQSDGAAGR